MAADQQLQSILIVGGGTAGWMTASYLSKFLGNSNCSITVVESPEDEPVGVGEATLPSLVRFVRNMGFDEVEFMTYCHATYKLAIRFDGWGKEESGFWHPFGVCGEMINHMDLFHHWYRKKLDDGLTRCYSDYSLQAQLCQESKAPRSYRSASPIIHRGGYAYHIDASSFADYLKAKAIPAGVLHMHDRVNHATLSEQGAIASLQTDAGRELVADLYIDCSGFSGLLIEQHLADPFVDWSPWLHCDRAVVGQTASGASMPPYTSSRAMKAGWLWHIPLAHRTGWGYVYASSLLDDEEAIDEVRQHYGWSETEVQPRWLTMKVGRRTHAWIHNCIAIGLSAGFVEPLESTGLHLIQSAIEDLMDFFPDRSMNPALRDRFNSRFRQQMDEVRDFLLIHYAFAEARELPFWQAASSPQLPDSLQNRLALYRECGIVDSTDSLVFNETSYHHILNGLGFFPSRAHSAAAMIPETEVDQLLSGILERQKGILDEMPDHRRLVEFMGQSQLDSPPGQ